MDLHTDSTDKVNLFARSPVVFADLSAGKGTATMSLANGPGTNALKEETQGHP